MKKKIIAAATITTIAGTAHAQSSVTLYGLIDAGISYVNNSTQTSTKSGSKLYKYDDGVAQGSRWGLRGTEDLGGGLKALFVLENGFNSGNGTLGQGSSEFGRQAYVGISKDSIGSFTLGRQYSFSTDYLGGNYSNGGNTVAGNYGYHINDVDQLTSSRISNSVKFTSANFAGLTFGAMYGFSNQAGAFSGAAGSSSRAYSFGANYATGAFSVGTAYTDIRFPAAATPAAFSTNLANITLGSTANPIRDLHTVGLGGRYILGPATLWALWTNTHIEPISGAQTTFNAYEAGGKYAFTPALTAGLGYTYMKVSDAFSGHWNQIDASVDYALSKRTDVYLLTVYQKASGNLTGTTTPIQAQIGDSASSYFGTSGTNSTNQVAVRVGIRHKF
ncbi:porin [Trinickia violacea]|uniref:Porin n=1 Tax=Trinickia violacea TaxID=2571746 RepID=A0A4P8J202_9BURK|nr:porin [Trinickia violacea]QCP54043.1 porin [Trinickia violacea]